MRTDRPTRYRLTRRATVRSAPTHYAQALARLPLGYEVSGYLRAGWVEWVRDGETAGYIKATYVEEAQERTVGDTTLEHDDDATGRHSRD